MLPADVENDESWIALFARLKKEWGRLDFLVHAIAFSDREELKGRYVDTTAPISTEASIFPAIPSPPWPAARCR